MTDLVTYRTFIADSERWARFEHRPGDIVISTPPKSGTTWTQMLCALSVFDRPDFPAQLDAMSPWLDSRIRSEDEVFSIYEHQTHRRFIKTHTPLDGLPLRDDVTYVVVGRDPRDVLVSWEHHLANIDLDVIVRSRAEAVGLDDLVGTEAGAPTDLDPAVRFRQFVEAAPSTTEQVSLANVLHHLATAWDRRAQPNVGLFHFLDYQRDLVTEMVRLDELCGFGLGRERLAELAPEAGIARMRDRADEITPDISKSGHFKDPAGFFRSGASGEWADRVNPDDLDRYAERVAELAPEPLARWSHEGGPRA
ncbi:MAG TPA: sulfotransferase domain-containing protein [Ilumatobacteraceae bacterium]|nr:sulfotransferase domain-containing protein [Ilumatobacteraceae bacterium]